MSASSKYSNVQAGRFSNHDLMTVAVLSALGGVMSAYIGYLGNLMNRFMGVPFGAGQFMAGLHVFWIVVAYGLIRKPGAAIAVGLLKGVVELFMGSTHGAMIVVVSLAQGGLYEAFKLPTRNDGLFSTYMGAGLASTASILVFYLLYLRAFPGVYILLLVLLAFSSGVIFGGYFGTITLEELLKKENSLEGRKRMRHVAAVVFVSALAIGAVFYFAMVYSPPSSEMECSLEGLVESPYIYRPGDFSSHETTVFAELQGSHVHVPPRNYTGVPLYVLVDAASPMNSAARIRVIASDGYSIEFSFESISGNKDIILSAEDGLTLIAEGYDGSQWVRNVVRIQVI